MRGEFGISVTVEGRSESDLGAALAGRLDEVVRERRHRIGLAYVAAMGKVADQGKSKLRQDIIAGGFANASRLSKTWRGRSYPRANVSSLEPAAVLSSNARTIIEAFSTGITIRVRNRRFLAIPQGPAKAIVRQMNRAGNRSRDASGRFSGEADPVARVAAALGVTLVPIISPDGRHGVLVSSAGHRLTRTGRMARSQSGGATVLFALVKQATLRRRIRGTALVEDIKRSFERDFASALATTLLPEDHAQ